MTWDGKVFLVAGVGGGLGAAVVAALAETGATVVGIARGSATLGELESIAHSRNWKFHPIHGDMRVQKDADRAVTETIDRHGRLDGVSINVGHWIRGSPLLHETKDQEWLEGLADNLDPVLHLGRAVIPHFMAHGGGRLVLVSAAQPVRWAGTASYSLAKAGLADLVGKLGRDYRPYGIRCNAVLPGNMGSAADPHHPPEASEVRLETDNPTSPWQVAYAIRYFLSDDSAWVTGTTLTVDGGFTSGGPGQTGPAPPPSR